MIDVLKRVGLAAMPQVDPATRQNRHQPLRDLSLMSYSVVRAVARRLRQEGRLNQARDPNLPEQDRKSTRLNSSHANISYAVFCLNKNTHKSYPDLCHTNHQPY